MLEQVILVNEADEPAGTMEKMKAHELGLLHRAFSVFIFNSSGDMLLQQRALSKYHSGGLWTNACCSHPRPGETTHNAAVRRLQEELGFTADVNEIFDFTYTADFENGLIENEYDHVLAGIYDGAVTPVPAEVVNFAWYSLKSIEADLKSRPERYTAWFHIAFPKIEAWAIKNFSIALNGKRA